MKPLARLSLAIGSVIALVSIAPISATHASTVARHALTSPATSISRASSYNQGNAYLKQGKYAQAASAFQHAINQHDHTAQAYGGLAVANLDRRQYRAAFVAYQQAIKLAPTNADYVYGAAFAAVSSHAQDLATYAISYSQDYMAARRNDVKGYIVAFLAYSSLLQGKGELSAAKQIVRLRPNAPDSYNYLGIGYANSRNLKPAVAAFTRAIKLRPTVTQFWVNRGGVEVVMKKYTLGLKDYQHARSLTTSAVEQKYIDALIKGVHSKMHK